MKKKPPILSLEEKNIFRNAMDRVTPYHQKEPIDDIPEKHVQKPVREQSRTIEFSPPPHPKTPHYTLSAQQTVTGHDTLSFQHTGLQHKKFSQLKQGKLQIEATLDLHEHTRERAIVATDDFLNRCQNRGFRVVCIIHGKGLYSTNNLPVLKNLLNAYLRSHPCVLAFHSARHNQGGAGALTVLLKTK